MDKKITLVNIKFKVSACKKLPKKELDNIRDTALSFYDFINLLGTSSNFVVL